MPVVIAVATLFCSWRSTQATAPWTAIEFQLIAVISKNAIADLLIQRVNSLVRQGYNVRIVSHPLLLDRRSDRRRTGSHSSIAFVAEAKFAHCGSLGGCEEPVMEVNDVFSEFIHRSGSQRDCTAVATRIGRAWGGFYQRFKRRCSWSNTMIVMPGRSDWSSSTPASVTCVLPSMSRLRLVRPIKCRRPASVT